MEYDKGSRKERGILSSILGLFADGERRDAREAERLPQLKPQARSEAAGPPAALVVGPETTEPPLFATREHPGGADSSQGPARADQVKSPADTFTQSAERTVYEELVEASPLPATEAPAESVAPWPGGAALLEPPASTPDEVAYGEEPTPDGSATSWEAAVLDEAPRQKDERRQPAPASEEAPEEAQEGPDAAPYLAPTPLSSPDVAERRRALERLVEQGLGPDHVDLAGALVLDPNVDIRLLAIRGLRQRPDDVDPETISRALLDPIDEVRAAAVRLAAARGGRDHLVPLGAAAERRWPLTQEAVLETLPGLLAADAIHEEELALLLEAVATMDSPPLGPERARFAQLARCIGAQRLIPALDLPGPKRVGAARLLLEEGSEQALRAVAERAEDPHAEVHSAARSALELLGIPAEPTGSAPDEPVVAAEMPSAPPAGSEVDLETDAQTIAGLAQALSDPEATVRDQAAAALGSVDRASLADWARRTLESGSAEEVSVAARAAEALSLTETAPEILGRATQLHASARGPCLGALSSFGLSPAHLVDLVPPVEPARRPEAVRIVWQVAGRSSLPYLRTLLGDSSGPVRMAVLDIFGESGDPAAIEVAHGVLEVDSSPAVRATAIKVIGRAGLDQRATSLDRALDDPDPDVRATAVEVLPYGMVRDAADSLLRALEDREERVWQAALRHLVTLPDEDLSILWTALRWAPERQRGELVSLLERSGADRLAQLALGNVISSDPAERMLAVSLAGRAGTAECLQAAMQSLRDPAVPVRRAAAAALSTARDPLTVPALGLALHDPDPQVRIEAVLALGEIDDDDVIGFLISALKDPDPAVRERAAEAMARWSSPSVARQLARVLSTPSLRRPAGDVLARMGQAAVEPLLEVLAEHDPELAPTVGEILARIAGPESFRDRLTSMDPEDRRRSVEALGAIGGPVAVDGLLDVLTDPDERIRARAVRLLGELGDQRAFEAVKRTFLGDPVLEVVTAAEEALGRLQPDAPGQDR